MINIAMKDGQLPKGVNKNMITFLFKTRAKKTWAIGVVYYH